MPAIVAVAIVLPLGLAPELTAAVLHNCELAIGAGACGLATPDDSSNHAPWLARVVRPVESPRAMRVELLPLEPQLKPTSYSRWLDFEKSDRPLHQWSAVGVVIAALTIAAEAERTRSVTAEDQTDGGSPADAKGEIAAAKLNATAAVPSKTPSKTGRTPEAPLSTQASPLITKPPRATARLDVGGLLGPGLESRQLRYGLTIRPSLELSPHWAVTGQLTASRSLGSITTRWLSGELGLSLIATSPASPLAVEARLGAFVETLAFNASDASGAEDEASRWRQGFAAGLDAIVPLVSSFGWFVAADGRVATPRVRIELASREIAEVPTLTFAFSTGLRWRIGA